MQYSYLNSPLSLPFQPEYGTEAARALFAAIYGHWTTLPKDRRPRLYLHGLSLDATNSQNDQPLESGKQRVLLDATSWSATSASLSPGPAGSSEILFDVPAHTSRTRRDLAD
ncbi:alpha/beta-hydrolase family protein [Bradyrhizobium sp. 149]|uniref:alpha/beta-hydrolase family protein n=1 Tax=Bradyrhizobium sp. 149 TaxID=2782624 RepID=UPI003209AE54